MLFRVKFVHYLKTSLCLTRHYSDRPVRVRFAPSPTGYLHLGGLRTALYNYLFALSKNGTMILRIEDTDQSRKIDGAMEAMIGDLEWAGIKCHEGPTQGGNYGPYIQSERCSIYQKEVQTLVENGSAYKCFCTDRRLNLLRRDALRNSETPKYDNKCRSLTQEEVDKKIKNNESYCIRFKLSSNCSTFEDLIYGNIAYDVSSTEGDPVIMKTDGFPTYHLANVIDDHLMEISHVLRGVEWQISTTKHILMYKAFGWDPPKFGHLPLIINSDGTKLSKRQGDIRVQNYRKNGIYSEALVNYITLSGGGFPHTVGGGIQHNTIKDLVDQFNLELVNPSPSKMNPDLLTECSRLYIMDKVKDGIEIEKLCDQVQLLIESKLADKKINTSRDYLKSVLKWSSGRIKNLDELVSPSMLFLWSLPDIKEPLEDLSMCLINKFIDLLRDDLVPVKTQDFKVALKEFCKNNDVKYNDFMHLLRHVICGLEEGPSIAEIIEVLGKDVTIQRLDAAVVFK